MFPPVQLAQVTLSPSLHTGAVYLMLQTGVGLTELCSSLLRLVLPTEHHCQDLSQEDLASNMCHTMVTECVTEAVRDERAPPLLLDCVPPKTIADRLHVLEFLFHEALATVSVSTLCVTGQHSVGGICANDCISYQCVGEGGGGACLYIYKYVCTYRLFSISFHIEACCVCLLSVGCGCTLH